MKEDAISRLNRIITIQNQTATADEYGNHINTWSDYYTCHAKATTSFKNESDDKISIENKIVIFDIRSCSQSKAITSINYRVIFNNESYNILSVDPSNYDNKIIRLRCEKEVI